MNSMSTLERDASAADPANDQASEGGVPRRPSFWARVGGFSFRKRRRVLIAWVAVFVATIIGVGVIGPSSDSNQESPSSDSAKGFDILSENFGAAGSFISGSIVFEADAGVFDARVEDTMAALFERVAEIDDVTLESPYAEGAELRGLVAPPGDGGVQRIAIARVGLAEGSDEIRASEVGKEILALAENPAALVDGIDSTDLEAAGLNIEIGGANLAEFKPPESELIGVAFAIVILIVAFGSVLAMGLPIGVALFGVGIGIGSIQLLSNVMTIPSFATTIGAMIGLGVGIDYALFIVTRYREGTRAGLDPELATITAIDTAGRAVFFAGFTVVISLLGMFVMNLSFVNGLATGAALTVAITMLASVTLLPALLGFAQHRVEVTRWRGLIMAGAAAVAALGVGLGIPMLAALGGVIVVGTLLLSFVIPGLRDALPPRPEKPIRDTLSYRWSRFVQKRPWPMALGVTALFVFLSLPVLGLRLGFGDESTFAEGTTTRDAYELVAEGFGPGTNGPLLLVAETSNPSADLETAGRVVAALKETDGIANALGPIPSENDQAALQIIVFPESGPQDEATGDLVRTLRDDVIPTATAGSDLDLLVTGSVAASVDFSAYLGDRLPLFFIAVLSLSFLLLMMVFRSVLVPLKAVIMNMLSIGGAYGVMIAIFQWGWGVSLFGTGNGPIEPFLPMMLFAIVFGLSMDYEVFLLSRVKEEYDKTGDAVTSVADGLAATARVITAAAAIMVVVFGSFVLEDNRVVKMFGFGLATAVFLDATLVRMLLVPATMELLGEKNWWLPRWLDRILPTLNVEGGHDTTDAAPVESDLVDG